MYARKPLRPLKEIAIVDEATIVAIAALVPSGYTHPSTHPATMIVPDESNRFVSDTEKNYWSAKQAYLGFVPATESHTHEEYEPVNSNIQTHISTIHAPSNAEANNISDVNAGLLTGGQEISLHSHAGGSGLNQQQILRLC
jgi:hypothetical protein